MRHAKPFAIPAPDWENRPDSAPSRPKLTHLATFFLPLGRPRPAVEGTRWGLATLAGRMVELSSVPGSAAANLTAVATLVAETQLGGEPAAWISGGVSSFYPPDLAESGVDLAALPVVRAGTVDAATRATERLLRSGAFGLVVVDLADPRGSIALPLAAQSRLSGLARRHHTALLLLTAKPREAPSIGSLVSLRAEGTLRRTGFDRFEWTIEVLKDKRRDPGWKHTEACRGPDGLY